MPQWAAPPALAMDYPAKPSPPPAADDEAPEDGALLGGAGTHPDAYPAFHGDDLFQRHPNILIKQRFEALECLGFEAKNRYDVGLPDHAEQLAAGSNMLYIDEESACCERICCGPNRGLTLRAHSGSSKMGPVMLTMRKPCHMQGSCCARCRPSLEVRDRKRRVVGTVEDPFRCCQIDQQIYDAGGQLRYTLGPESLCQLGICCPLCADVSFPVYRHSALGAREPAARVVKKQLTCAEACAKTNRLRVDFRDAVDPTDRMLVFAATMLLDLEYFEVRKG